MSKKYLIVGGVAGGASAAARLRRLGEEDEIVMFERGPNVSFSNCCLPYHLSGQIKNAQDLVLMDPEKFRGQYNIDARVNSEVLSIDRTNKELEVKNLVSGETYKKSYDKLILSPGANAIVPPIPGIEKANIFIVKNVVDIDQYTAHSYCVFPGRGGHWVRHRWKKQQRALRTGSRYWAAQSTGRYIGGQSHLSR